MRIWAVIPAAGDGVRLGTSAPKALVEVASKPLLLHTIARLRAAIEIQHFIVPVPAAHRDDFARRHADFLSENAITLVNGGTSRTASVAGALEKVDETADIILVHDAARPLVALDVVRRCVSVADDTGAAIAAVPVADTVKEADASMRIKRTLDREKLWLIQTPQVFRADLLREAYRQALRDGCDATDDSALVERLGLPVTLVRSTILNFKITTPDDLRLFATILKNPQ